MIQKKLLAVAFLIGLAGIGVSTAAVAAAPGFYVGGQLGYSNTHYGTGDFPFMTSSNTSSTGLGVRPFVGYQFDQNWAVEGGYTRFANTSVKSIVLAPGNPYSATNTLPNGSIKQSAWDIVGKGMLPFDNGFGAYAKAGLAYVRASRTDGLTVYRDVNKWRPTFGIGGSYDFNPNVSVDVSWNRIVSGGGIDNADFVAAGISYHFG